MRILLVSGKAPTLLLRQHRIRSRHLSIRMAGTTTNTSSSRQPKFAEDSDTASLAARLSLLLSSSATDGRWTLTAAGDGLERSFKFKTFAKTWDFMTAVSLQCKIKNHHPVWSNVFNTTFIRWTTHVPKGLSAKDIDMAELCDLIARDFGETEPPASTGELKDLTDQTAASAGDCCGPRPR